MFKVYRLVYASEANVKLGEKGINLEVGRILLKSKNNNAKLSVGGVLYFADGYFFQVLEGEKQVVQDLYRKICKDERHSNTNVLLEGYIDAPQFANWSMHFVAAGSSIRQLLKDFGFTQFTPFIFSQPLIEMLIKVLSANGQYEKSKNTPSVLSKLNIFASIKRVFHKKKAA